MTIAMDNRNAHYFDYAAATPLDRGAYDAMQPYWMERFHNPSALYVASRSVRHELEEARAIIAQELGARPSEIALTAGGSEANNLAIHGVMRHFFDKHLVVSAVEHDSVLLAARRYDHSLAPVTPKGIVDVTALMRAVNDNTVLVSVMYANNEVGAIQPIRDIAAFVADVRRDRAARRIKTPLFVHTDACQAGNYLDMHTHRLGVDLLSINGGKVYGPKQSGALYVRAGVRLQPLVDGGGQEWGLRSGTENVALAVGFATAWRTARHMAHAESHRLTAARDFTIAQLLRQVPGLIINGPTGSKRIANNIHITIPGYDNERLLMELDERGFQIATGSACSASSDEPSHVLKAMGLSDEHARQSIRITCGRMTSGDALASLVDTITNVVAKH